MSWQIIGNAAENIVDYLLEKNEELIKAETEAKDTVEEEKDEKKSA